MWDNGKSQRTILHTTSFALPEMSIHKVHEGLTKFYSMLAEIFKESDRVHTYPLVATLQQREEWTCQPHVAVVTYTEYRDLYNKDSVIPSLIYLKESNDKDEDPHVSTSDPPSTEPTPEPGSPREKPTE